MVILIVDTLFNAIQKCRKSKKDMRFNHNLILRLQGISLLENSLIELFGESTRISLIKIR